MGGGNGNNEDDGNKWDEKSEPCKHSKLLPFSTHRIQYVLVGGGHMCLVPLQANNLHPSLKSTTGP